MINATVKKTSRAIAREEMKAELERVVFSFRSLLSRVQLNLIATER